MLLRIGGLERERARTHHSEQETAPETSVELPAAHAVHTDAPSLEEKRPAEQTVRDGRTDGRSEGGRERAREGRWEGRRRRKKRQRRNTHMVTHTKGPHTTAGKGPKRDRKRPKKGTERSDLLDRGCTRSGPRGPYTSPRGCAMQCNVKRGGRGDAGQAARRGAVRGGAVRRGEAARGEQGYVHKEMEGRKNVAASGDECGRPKNKRVRVA